MIENQKLTGGGEIVRLLWTGGWDSTFRLVELSRQEVTVQPTYMFGDGRHSMNIEREHQEKILELLRNHPETRANILPIKLVDIHTLPKNKEISEAYHNIIQKYKLGSQYEWIGWYAAIHPGCELGIEKPLLDGMGYMSRLIDLTGKVVPTNDMHRFKVESQSNDVDLLLGNLYFPIMFTTEIDMLNQIKEWGYEDVMKNIWFCYTPIKGKPCGMCRPCCEKMESGMEFLLDENAQKRYLRIKWRDRLTTKYGERSLIGIGVRAAAKTVRYLSRYMI